MNNVVAFDIETMPNMQMVDRLPEPDVKYGNTKDPAKMETKLAEAKIKQVDKMALSPLYGKIASFAISGSEESTMCSENEKEMLEVLFNKFFTTHEPYTFATWNGNDFDFPFLYRRAVALKIDLTGKVRLNQLVKRYQTTPHADLAKIWTSWGSHDYVKLDHVASVILGEKKFDFDVTTIKRLIKTPEGRAQIMGYNLQDANLTYELYQRFDGVLF